MNDKVYIHELIDVIGSGRARYVQHMTANWCPIAREERNQLCFGVWATVGSTGRWPEVVNLWEVDGVDGLAADFAHELAPGRFQDPSLAAWWEVAAGLRRGGVDRILVPAPWTPTIDELCARGVRGGVYAHELVTLPTGTAPAYLVALHEQGIDAHAGLGATSVGAFRVAMASDTECVVLWAFPDFATWAAFEQADLDGLGGQLGAWTAVARGLGASVRRTLMVDAPLAPLRTGRQPRVEDRVPLEDL